MTFRKPEKMPMTPSRSSLVCAYAFSPTSTTRLEQPKEDSVPGNWQWSHWNLGGEATRGFIQTKANLTPLVAEELLTEEARPGITRIDRGILLTLRGVNLNEGADPDQMLSLRIWIENDRIISVRSNKLFAVDAVRSAADAGKTWPSIGAFLVDIIEGITQRAEQVVEELEDKMDDYELLEIEKDQDPLRDDIIDLRRDVVNLRRFLTPQQDAVAKFGNLMKDQLEETDRQKLSVIVEDLGRINDMLAAIRERAMIVQEALDSKAASKMNRTMYLLSIVATIFLPLGFLTGLLGINVAGIPGADTPWAFAAFCVLLVGICALQLGLLRWMRIL